MTTSFKLPIKKGSVIAGKWKNGRYTVERLLGEGANGKVYLVSKDWQWYALKLGVSSIDLQSEINALKALAHEQTSGSTYLKDVDDWVTPQGKEIPFYTMRYVKGRNLADYIAQQGSEWFPLLGLNILRSLNELHRVRWIFGDLKLENIIVGEYGNIDLIDFGGATPFGKSVKQFTEIYDRGYWNEGSRSADASYDLFSFGVLCLQIFAPRKLAQLTKELIPQNRSADSLLELASEIAPLAPYRKWLEKAFKGGYVDGNEAAAAWRALAHQRKSTVVKSKATPRWLKVMIAISIISLTISASLYALDYAGLLK